MAINPKLAEEVAFDYKMRKAKDYEIEPYILDQFTAIMPLGCTLFTEKIGMLNRTYFIAPSSEIDWRNLRKHTESHTVQGCYDKLKKYLLPFMKNK